MQVLQGHTSWVNGVCAVPAGQRELLASAGADGTVRVWDPGTGVAVQVLQGHTSWVNGVCAVRVAQRELLASASDDRTVRVWDPGIAQPLFVIPTPSPALTVAQFGISSLIVGLVTGVLTVSLDQR
ncbi:MAG: hypothetical protein ACR2GH_13210 [Pseudonocardia sp.]